MNWAKTSKIFTHNGNYKVVSLFVSLVLWVTILGRKDLIVNHDMQLQLLLKPHHTVTNRYNKQVRVKLSGPRSSIKKFTRADEVITINLENVEPGRRLIKIPTEGLNLPLGVKVVSITPSRIMVSIVESTK